MTRRPKGRPDCDVVSCMLRVFNETQGHPDKICDQVATRAGGLWIELADAIVV